MNIIVNKLYIYIPIVFQNIIYINVYVLFLFYRNLVKYKLDFIHKAPFLKHDKFRVLFYNVNYYIGLFQWYRYIQYSERTKSSWKKYCLQVGAIAIWYRQGTGITGLFSCRLGYMLCLSIKYCRFYTEYKLSIDGIKYFVHREMNSKTESHTLQNPKQYFACQGGYYCWHRAPFHVPSGGQSWVRGSDLIGWGK